MAIVRGYQCSCNRWYPYFCSLIQCQCKTSKKITIVDRCVCCHSIINVGDCCPDLFEFEENQDER